MSDKKWITFCNKAYHWYILTPFYCFFKSVDKKYNASPAREGIDIFKEKSLIQFDEIHKKID